MSEASYLETARRAWSWIDSRLDLAESTMIPTLYHGLPGTLLFAVALHRTTRTTRWPLDLARPLEVIRDQMEVADMALGLYDGLAGIAAVASRFDALGYAREWRALADEIMSRLLRQKEDWGTSTDIISGASGIGLLMLELHRREGNDRALRSATRTGDWLIANARPHRSNGIEWTMEIDRDRIFPNFSHGTAGVVSFLAELHAATGERRFLESALRGVASLEATRRTEGDTCCWYHHRGDGERLYYGGWCHGPAGTARAYYGLYRTTKNETWLERVHDCARWTMKHARAKDLESGTGFWNLGRCCGAAGVGDFLADMYRATGEKRYLNAARAMADHLTESADQETAGVKWMQAEHRLRPDERTTQTGLMQGAAGIGLFLLKMHRIDQGESSDPFALPDNPFR